MQQAQALSRRVTVGQPVVSNITFGLEDPSQNISLDFVPGTSRLSSYVHKIIGVYAVDVDCTSSIGMEVVHERTTGPLLTLFSLRRSEDCHDAHDCFASNCAQIDGLPILVISPLNGRIGGFTHSALRELIPATMDRYFDVTCDVYASIASSAFRQRRLVKAKSKLQIRVRDDHCWVNAFDYGGGRCL
mmetsp:Transcript_2271/g.4369  ORF Transcript_2271/g.4369 Transcript_2271/m.4369 type:complete len:188 (+) Transcript_2271:782-1345(+)